MYVEQDLSDRKPGNSQYPRGKENDLVLKMPMLDRREAQQLISACGELGADPSSDYFATRTKNIAYVVRLGGQWFQLRASCFVQSETYNDFSGGYQRCYQEMPEQFLECQATKKVLDAFQSTYNIPEGEPILVQVQQSHINPNTAGKCLTGQGIHSDGADRALLVCLERQNIEGAENAVYRDLEGKQALLDPFVLHEGEAMFWHDNQVFHHVQSAQPVDREAPGTRTVLIAHYPAIHYLQGTVNPNNNLRTQAVEPEKRLRQQA